MKVALIAGAGGAASKRLIEVLLADPDWSVIGLARTPRRSADRLGWIAADLSDRDGCRRALAGQTAVTHIFYTARAKHGETGVESVPDNVAMLRNLIDAIEPVASGLEHLHLVQGTKYYGMHLGPFRTPAREDDPRPDFPNFYYDQQDLLAERTRGKTWAWSASRPTFIYDFAPERARNAIAVIGAYAALCRELHLPLDFPGSAAAFDAQRDLTDASLLARAMKFMSVTPACRNEAFNVTNGDVVTWRVLWPRLADFFGIAAGEVRPFSLHEWSRDKQPAWDAIVRKHGLASDIARQCSRLGVRGFPLGAGLRCRLEPGETAACRVRRNHRQRADAARASATLSRREDPAVITLDQLNASDSAAFVAAVGDVFEHAPWVAERAYAARPFASVAALHDAMMQAVRSAPREQQLAFLRGHPELAGKVARAGAMTADSRSEQGGLGLNRLSDTDFARFERANAAYARKFGFPFIVCVRLHKSAESILAAFEQRVGNDPDDGVRGRAHRDRPHHAAAA